MSSDKPPVVINSDKRRTELRRQVVDLARVVLSREADSSDMGDVRDDDEDEYCRWFMRRIADKLRASAFVV